MEEVRKMDSDLISRKALLQTMNEVKSSFKYEEKLLINAVQLLILTQPTVDAVEVVHGEWEQLCDPSFSTNFPTISRCTACGMKYNLPNISYNYCPHCGADMRGEKDE